MKPWHRFLPSGCAASPLFDLKKRIRKPIQVGLLGIGTVGSGTFTVLQRNQEESAAAPAASNHHGG